MDGSIKNVSFEHVMELLEEIVTEDPHFEFQEEADFIQKITDHAPSYFRSSQAKTIIALHAKYCDYDDHSMED